MILGFSSHFITTILSWFRRYMLFFTSFVAFSFAQETELKKEVSQALTSSLGAMDVQKNCWPQKEEEETYCFKIQKIKEVNAHDGQRIYVVLDANREGPQTFGGSHAFFTFQRTGSQLILLSKLVNERNGSWGEPVGYSLVLLGAKDYWGWRSDHVSITRMGSENSFFSVLLPFKDTFASRTFSARFDNESSGAKPAELMQVDATISFVEDPKASIYSLKASVSVQEKGWTKSKEYVIPFNRKQWTWDTPTDYPSWLLFSSKE